jgi:hypothetical protein
MNNIWKTTIAEQLGAAIDMLDNAIVACPDKLWSDHSQKVEYWYIAYHTLFFLDLYLSGSVEGFTPPAPFTLSELDPAGIIPEQPYTKEELQNYLNHNRRKCQLTIEALTDQRACEKCSFQWLKEVNRLDLIFISIRHVQHHTAQLNLILRQQVNSAPRWVSKAKINLSQ